MSQLYAQTASRPDPWLLGRTSAGLCTLQTACPLTVTYSGGSPTADTIAAGSAATVYGGSAAAFDASADVWVVLTVPASGALQVVKEALLATVTGDWAGLARIVQHAVEPYQPQASLASGGSGAITPLTSTPVVSDTTAKALSLWNGSGNDAPPAAWQTSGFSDSGWGAAVVSYDESPQGNLYITGTHIIWPANPGVPTTTGQEQALFRHHVTLPAGTLSSATLTLVADIILEALYVNGSAVGAWPHTFPSLPATDTQTYDVSGVVAMGAANVIALWVSNDNNPSDPSGGAAYKLTLTYSGPGISGATEGDVLYYHAGTWTNLPIGPTGYELTVVAGDPAWTAQPADTDTSGTVTSVALSGPTGTTVSGSPVTSSGTLSLAWSSQSPNVVLASPSASSGAPTFRKLVSQDLPPAAGAGGNIHAHAHFH